MNRTEPLVAIMENVYGILQVIDQARLVCPKKSVQPYMGGLQRDGKASQEVLHVPHQSGQ